jgi:hypothetical protein
VVVRWGAVDVELSGNSTSSTSFYWRTGWPQVREYDGYRTTEQANAFVSASIKAKEGGRKRNGHYEELPPGTLIRRRKRRRRFPSDRVRLAEVLRDLLRAGPDNIDRRDELRFRDVPLAAQPSDLPVLVNVDLRAIGRTSVL